MPSEKKTTRDRKRRELAERILLEVAMVAIATTIVFVCAYLLAVII